MQVLIPMPYGLDKVDSDASLKNTYILQPSQSVDHLVDILHQPGVLHTDEAVEVGLSGSRRHYY